MEPFVFIHSNAVDWGSKPEQTGFAFVTEVFLMLFL